MHYIGNRAIEMESSNGAIVYDSGYTAISFFLPIVFLLPAFYILAITTKARSLMVIIAGFISGIAVSTMHYIGNRGMLNYFYYNQKGYIVASNAIAVCASIIALSVFFRLQETWTNSWWKRSLCAVILAGGVSGMHWTGTAGTSYWPKDGAVSSGMSRTQVVIICTILVSISSVIRSS